jgi:hypothetical protein
VLIWTVLCAIPVFLLVEVALRPTASDCREFCDIGLQVAGAVVPIIVVIWAAVAGLVIWLYRRR